jgi:hypothetical protein
MENEGESKIEFSLKTRRGQKIFFWQIYWIPSATEGIEEKVRWFSEGNMEMPT